MYKFTDTGETVDGYTAHNRIKVGDWKPVELGEDGEIHTIVDMDDNERELEYVGPKDPDETEGEYEVDGEKLRENARQHFDRVNEAIAEELSEGAPRPQTPEEQRDRSE